MVWGAIAYNRRRPLIFLSKDERKGVDYVRNILSGPLWDFYEELYDERGVAKVVEDGAPIHTCKVAKDFRISNCLETLPHPAHSPDMNPIEHCWFLMKGLSTKEKTSPIQ